jgi:glycerophosphoryl diester phosphodiesterase
MPYFDRPRPRVFGHRGAAGLAPENTLPSFALAAALGAGYLELDVHSTRDGTIVVIHDPSLERTTNGEGPVLDHTFAQLQALDAGYRFTSSGGHFPYRGQGVRIPALESVLRTFPAQAFNIEIKQEQPNIVGAVVDLLANTGTADRTLLAAEHDSIMQSIRAIAGECIATGISTGEVVDFIGRVARDDWDGYQPRGRALQIPPSYEGIELVTPATVAAAHRLGIEVHVWTINEPAEIERLLELGVDGVMSDLPGLVVTAAGTSRGKGRE